MYIFTRLQVNLCSNTSFLHPHSTYIVIIFICWLHNITSINRCSIFYLHSLVSWLTKTGILFYCYIRCCKLATKAPLCRPVFPQNCSLRDFRYLIQMHIFTRVYIDLFALDQFTPIVPICPKFKLGHLRTLCLRTVSGFQTIGQYLIFKLSKKVSKCPNMFQDTVLYQFKSTLQHQQWLC